MYHVMVFHIVTIHTIIRLVRVIVYAMMVTTQIILINDVKVAHTPAKHAQHPQPALAALQTVNLIPLISTVYVLLSIIRIVNHLTAYLAIIRVKIVVTTVYAHNAMLPNSDCRML